MTTPTLGLTEVASADADKFVLHNRALLQLEGRTVRVISRTIGGPPGGETNGDAYIVDVATGDWSTASINDIAVFIAGAYDFFTPVDGMRLYVTNDNTYNLFDGTDWDTNIFVSGGGSTSWLFNLTDNTNNVFEIKEGSNVYMSIDTLNASELITFGNITTDPEFRFGGDGPLTIHGGRWDTGGIDLNSSDTFAINSTDVLTATTLGSAVVNSSLTNVGTLTALTVDNVVVNGNDISTSSGNLTLTPVGGSSVVIDGATSFDAGVVTGVTALTVDNVVINGNDVSSSSGNLTLTPVGGSAVVIDGATSFDAGVVTGMTSLTVTGTMQANDAAGPALLNEAATATNPTMLPNKTDPDTGVGWTSENILSLITAGVQGLAIDASQNVDIPNGGLTINGGTDLLDNYDEGTWTPTIQDSSLSDAESQTYFTQVGTYTRIGDIVHVQGRLEVNSLGSLTAGDPAELGGLPFTSNSTSGNTSSCHVGNATSLALPAATGVSGLIRENVTRISLSTYDVTTGTSFMLISEYSAGGNIQFSATYKI